MKRRTSRWGRGFPNVVTACISVLGSAALAADLTVTVDNIEVNRGTVHIIVFNAANWLDGNSDNFAGERSVDITQRRDDGPLVTRLELEPGEYAAFVYHDLNSNDKLDKTFIGLPKEPFAFSRPFNERRLPKFEECMFVVGEKVAAITVGLRKGLPR